jgi:hypothetical protein
MHVPHPDHEAIRRYEQEGTVFNLDQLTIDKIDRLSEKEFMFLFVRTWQKSLATKIGQHISKRST